MRIASMYHGKPTKTCVRRACLPITSTCGSFKIIIDAADRLPYGTVDDEDIVRCLRLIERRLYALFGRARGSVQLFTQGARGAFCGDPSLFTVVSVALTRRRVQLQVCL